jgi:hypothetical protein
MNSFLLVIVGHAFIIALFLYFLYYFLDVAFNILPHGSKLFQRLRDFCCFNLTYLRIPLRLFLEEVEVFISDVLEILKQGRIEISNGNFLDFMAILYFADFFPSLSITLFKIF